MKNTATCLCGNIVFELRGEPQKFSHCHCKMCQKSHGAAFGSYIRYPLEGFKVIKGEEKVFDSSEWAKRSFCADCGSTLRYIHKDAVDYICVAAGVLDFDPVIRPNVHIFTKDKACWFEITDNTNQLERY